jgi:hypothetical protein
VPVLDLRAPLRQAKTNLPEAWQWLEKSIRIKETFQNLNLQARGYANQGKTAEAIAAGEKAIQTGKNSTPQANPTAVAALEKLVAEWTTKK